MENGFEFGSVICSESNVCGEVSEMSSESSPFGRIRVWAVAVVRLGRAGFVLDEVGPGPVFVGGFGWPGKSVHDFVELFHCCTRTVGTCVPAAQVVII